MIMQFKWTRPVLLCAGLTIVLIIVAFIAAMLGSRNNPLPNSDEIYHLLAASSFVEFGEFSIGFGSYERAQLYTRYVAIGYQLFGQSLTAAKIVTGATFALLIGGVFLTLNRRIGTGASLLSAVLLLLAPHSLEIATTVRFYAPHALLFWIGAWSLYRVVAESDRSALFAAVAVVSLISAYHLQPATAIGVAAIGVWAALFLAIQAIGRGVSRKQLLVLSAVFLGALIAAYSSGLMELLWIKYRNVVPWNEGSRIQYYYWMMTKDYNPFWGALPLFSVLALHRAPKVGGFAVSVFAICFVLHSFGGMKEDRYIYYALPFFFVVVSIGLVSIYEFLGGAAEVLRQRLPFLNTGQSRRLANLLSTGAIAFLVISNLGYVSSVKDLFTGSTKREQPRWDLLASVYGDTLRSASVLLTNSPNHSLYILDRSPIGIGFNRLVTGSRNGLQFSQDRRTGAILISEPASLELVTDCFQDGYLIAEDRQWLSNPNSGITEDLLPIIQDRMDRVDVPGDWKMRLYSWSRSGTQSELADREGCASLTKIVK